MQAFPKLEKAATKSATKQIEKDEHNPESPAAKKIENNQPKNRPRRIASKKIGFTVAVAASKVKRLRKKKRKTSAE